MTRTSAPEPVSTGSVGWGILATGGIARLYAQDLRAHGHRIQAIGSRSVEAARSFADEFDVPAAYGSYAEMVADPNVDVVYVATPHSMHAENARQALAEGKHVLVEKAFTINAVEALSVVEMARDLGLLVMEAMWTRSPSAPMAMTITSSVAGRSTLAGRRRRAAGQSWRRWWWGLRR